jgi:two-component system, NarL family, nitrate/nitrite response regulator NarL
VSESQRGIVRVLIADAQTTTRAGVRMSLQGHGFTVCAEVHSAAMAIEAAVRERPDVCLIEVDLPGGGVAAAEEIKARVPCTSVVMLSGSVDEDELFASLRAGAGGYLLKDMDPARLPLALRGVLVGEAAVPRALVGRVLEEFRVREHGRHASELARLGVQLTRREREVLELLDRGLETSEMAERLAISSVTVRRHVSEILRKLEVPDRKAALRLLRGAGGL